MLRASIHPPLVRGLERPLDLRQSQPEVVQDLEGLVIKEEDPREEYEERDLLVLEGGVEALDAVGEGGGGEGLPQRLSEGEGGQAKLHSHRVHGGKVLDGKARGRVLGGSRVQDAGRVLDGGRAQDAGMGLGGTRGDKLHACILRGGKVGVEVGGDGRDRCGRGQGMGLSRVDGVAHSVLVPWGGKGHSDGRGGGGVQDGEEGGEGLLVHGHLPRVQSHGSQAHEPPRRTPDQHGGVGLEGGGGGGGGRPHMEPHGHLWPRRALLPEKKNSPHFFQTLYNWPLALESVQIQVADTGRSPGP